MPIRGEFVLTPGTVAHFLAGFLSALSVLVSPVLSLIGFVGFELYETWQYWERIDWPTGETLEFMVGFFVAIAALLVSSSL